MKIGVDAKVLCSTRPTGIPNYARNILYSLSQIMPNWELHFYIPESVDSTPLKIFRNCKIITRKCPRGLTGYFWTKFILRKLVLKDKIDVLLATRTLYPVNITNEIPVVSLVYDLNHLICPETMMRTFLFAHRMWFEHDIHRATRVVSISHGTSVRMNKLLGRCADAIATPAISEEYYPASELEISVVANKYNISGRYIMFTGNLEPRKNLSILLDAHQAVNSTLNDNIRLILVGQRGWRNKQLMRRLDDGVPNVIELGYVPNNDLRALYTGAEAFVMPSHYEGYGMPAAEASVCGTRVIATDIPELREAAGENAFFVQPSVSGLTNGILAALRSERPVPSPRTTWTRTSKILGGVLEDAVRSGVRT